MGVGVVTPFVDVAVAVVVVTVGVKPDTPVQIYPPLKYMLALNHFYKHMYERKGMYIIPNPEILTLRPNLRVPGNEILQRHTGILSRKRIARVARLNKIPAITCLDLTGLGLTRWTGCRGRCSCRAGGLGLTECFDAVGVLC